PWPDLATAIARLRLPVLGFDPSQLPALERSDGKPVTVDASALAGALAIEIGKRRPIGLVAAFDDTCTAGMRDRYAGALVAEWQRGGARPADQWVFEAAAILGGRRAVATLGRRIETLSYQRAVQAIDALVRIDHPHVVLELFKASRGYTQRAAH